MSISEDGVVNIWDTRPIDKEMRINQDYIWRPYLSISLIRSDGSGELGLSRLLFHPRQSETKFWAASDEGDLIQVDWGAKPAGGAQQDENTQKFVEYVKRTYESERNYRAVLALERSPFAAKSPFFEVRNLF